MAIQNFLEELSVQQLAEKYNFIVPEIQREYVWGNNDYQILDKFFTDIKEAINENNSNGANIKLNKFHKMLEVVDEQTKIGILSAMNKLSKKDLNIGFLYSYKPYYNYIGDKVDVYLIDGQQRLTTLFLALFYFSLKEQKNSQDFLNLMGFDSKLEKIGFDYRVRTLTHNFLIDLVQYCRKWEDLENITKHNWFLADYSNDVTVKAMVNAIEKLCQYFNDDKIEYYQFVKEHIRFWHFKTEETSQGEELYITMNSRGQQLADNETIRAKLFENDRVKTNQLEWGAKWEEWQDFFWKNKMKGGNADYGLNQFLRWVNVIECFSTQSFKTRESAEKVYKSLIAENQVLEYVSLFEIEPYFRALERLKLFADDDHFSAPYFQNNFSEEWLKGDTGQIHLLKLLPSLMFLKEERKIDEFNRYIRFFYNATNDLDIAKNPDNYIIESIELTKLFLEHNYYDVVELVNFKERFPRLLSSEEVCKLNLYKQIFDFKERKITEEAFWSAEDFKFSKGKIGHILQLTNYRGKMGEFIYIYNFNYETISTIDINQFKALFDSYSELIKKEDEIWGALLITSVYFVYNERLSANEYWHLNNDFLILVEERRKSQTPQLSLSDFLILREKEFVNSYEADIENESSVKKQVYLYYILHKRILGNWSWSKKNFGIYDGSFYPYSHSLFKEKYIYQIYDKQWRYNEGYKSDAGIWIQDNFDSKRNYLQELIDWAS